ncbi:MAG: hypothetical protein J2P45_31605 [Candidatus Dormibacteraeota bacterium]|nr:hypothetical protein [Candidatus Dormibacteraeota bacterium]
MPWFVLSVLVGVIVAALVVLHLGESRTSYALGVVVLVVVTVVVDSTLDGLPYPRRLPSPWGLLFPPRQKPPPEGPEEQDEGDGGDSDSSTGLYA